VVAGFPYLFGYATAEAVDKQLPVFLAAAWGVTLFIGAAVSLLGSFWSGSIANALTMERIGLGLTGGAGLVYGLCIVGARSLIAPLFVIGVVLGYWLLRIPLKNDHWGERTTRVVGDLLTVAGLVVIVGCTTSLMFTPALVVLVGAFVILGFGASCLSRARDIGKIFHRANETNPVRILREPEET
jgi:hypothetical protein